VSASRQAAWGAALAIALALGAVAETTGTPEPGDPLDEAFEAAEVVPEGMGDDLESYLISSLIDAGRLVRARERAQTRVAERPRSVGGHALLGVAVHLGDGHLAKARHHFERAVALYEEDYGLPPREGSPWRWHLLGLLNLAEVLGDMGRDAEKLDVLDHYEAYYGSSHASRGWALARLGRYAAARDTVQAGLADEDPYQQRIALNTLCVVEGETLSRQAAYAACLAAVDHPALGGRGDAVSLSNAAESALGVLAFDEAERLYQKTVEHFQPDVPANPWQELTRLYLAQGRTGESRDAMRAMFDWRRRQLASIDAQSRASVDLTSATLLLVAGHPVEAARVAGRSVERPDRLGRISFRPRARQGGAALLDRSANRTAAAWHRERASYSGFLESLRAHFQALSHELRAWWAGRRARPLLADERLLVHTVAPYAAGSVVLPEWLQLDVVGVAGAGPLHAALFRAEAIDAEARDWGYLRAMQAEVASVRGEAREALALARRALATGEYQTALSLFDTALLSDPGVLRRLRIPLPIRFETDAHSLAWEVESLLRASPRFDVFTDGFTLRTAVGAEEVVESCLIGPTGALHACAQLAPEAGESHEDQARRVSAEFHTRVFAPRVDLTQADLSSLDGSGAELSIRGTDRVRVLLDAWRAGSDTAP
jgi:tetratricopeptide (TPR) repeat protein